MSKIRGKIICSFELFLWLPWELWLGRKQGCILWYLLCSVFLCRMHRLLYWRRNIANCGLRLIPPLSQKDAVTHLLCFRCFTPVFSFSQHYVPQKKSKDAHEQKQEFCFWSGDTTLILTEPISVFWPNVLFITHLTFEQVASILAVIISIYRVSSQ